MSLKFNEALKILLEGLPKPLKPEHELYIQDAAEISEKINKELINMNSIFKGTVSHWKDTCTYLLKDIYQLWIPYLRINMPFKVEPQLVNPLKSKFYKLKTSAYHPSVENGYVNGPKLINLFYWDISQAIERLGKVNCKSGKIYSRLQAELLYRDGQRLLTIVVKEQEAQEAPSILYDFVTSFTFFSRESPQFRCCFGFFHKIEKVNYNRVAKTSDIVNKINILLLQLHLDSSLTVENMHNITSSVIFRSKQDKLEQILLEIIPHFFKFLKNPGPLKCAYGKLWQYKQADSVKVSELRAIFGIQ